MIIEGVKTNILVSRCPDVTPKDITPKADITPKRKLRTSKLR